MAVAEGQQLGQYRLIEKIGEGGMGAVWKARDPALGRYVAVKVLPETFAQDRDRLGRFEREARVLAAVTHPNVASIHGLHEADGLHFLAMELLSGEDLARRLERGRPSVPESLEIARQIAEALEAAHANGVMHRDLKPANVQITEDGAVKVLDFGLAKALGPTDSSSQATTLVAAETGVGTILGTPSYMSPEQARGQPVDKRSDVWSFGCVLYEMLAGREAFGGDTPSDILAHVLESDANWDALPGSLPPPVHRLLRRCLQKDVARRLHDVGDARIEIEDTLLELSGAGSLERSPEPTRPRRNVAFVGALLLLGAALTALGFFGGQLLTNRASPASIRPVTRFLVEDPLPWWPPSPSDYPTLALAPDGDQLVYLSQDDQRVRALLRRTNELVATELSHISHLSGAFFSPDGQWLAYFYGGVLRKVALRGGAPIDIASASLARGGSWGDDGNIVFSPFPESGLFRVSSAGGQPTEELTKPDRSRGERTHRWPYVLPGSRAVLLTVGTSDIQSFDNARIDVLSLDTGLRHTLIPNGTFPLYVPTGHLLYIHNNTLMAVPFDAERLSISGDPESVVSQVADHPFAGCAQLAVSNGGTLAYLQGKSRMPSRTLAWIDASGARTPVSERPRAYNGVKVSPDGGTLAYDVDGATGQISTLDIVRGTVLPLTREWSNTRPVWTPNSKRVAFASDRLGSGNVFWQAADGSGSAEQLTQGPHKQWPTSWSPDGRVLAYTEQTPDTVGDIWLYSLDDNKATRFEGSPHWEDYAMFSPHGGWIAYVSNETGRREVYVQPHPSDGRKFPITAQGGDRPRWSTSGDHLYYHWRGRVMVVDVTLAPTFEVTSEGRTVAEDVGYEFDIAPKGRIIAVVVEEKAEQAPIQVVVNWLEELQELTSR